jgi:hypothetical protein
VVKPWKNLVKFEDAALEETLDEKAVQPSNYQAIFFDEQLAVAGS